MKKKKNKKKNERVKIFTAIDTNQSSFMQPAKKKQLKLARESKLGEKKKSSKKEVRIPKKIEEPIKDLDDLKPIDHGFIALPHTPVYKMHRYFARRPWSVFNELVRHYSNPGSIILDPFCGGGVTVVEGLKLRRKVIGIDLNPMATFITRMEVIDVDLNELKKIFQEIEKSVKDEIQELYLTICPKCKKETPAEWFEWSYIYECPNCKKKVQLSEAKKLKGGKYICSHCKEIFKLVEAKRIGEVPIRLKVNCEHCGFKGEKKPDEHDFRKVKWIEKNFEEIIKKKKLWYPKDKIIYGKETQRLFNAGLKYFYELFTKRNLIGLSILSKEINKIKDSVVKELLFLTFCNNLRFATSMCFCAEKWRAGEPLEWAAHGYWAPILFAEVNVLKYLNKSFIRVIKGKEYSQKEIGSEYRETKNFTGLQKDKTCLILTRSSTELPLPDSSIDAVITDPPYGGNVNYTELSDFWAIWIKDILGIKPNELIDYTEEVIENRYQGKGAKEYRDLMYKVFKECHRVLRPNRWMVMTFHNRNFQTWNAIHLAAHDAGFILSEEDGMIYQPPIQQYVTTLHQRSGGSMLGDFILSFQKAEKVPEKKMIEYVEVDKKIEDLAAESILHHGGKDGGTSLSTIYMKLMPFLLNQGLLGKIEKEEGVIPYLRENFEERNGKWYLKESANDRIKKYLSGYSKMHYKEDYRVLDFVPVEARLEYLIRRILYQKGTAKQDEILNEIYTNLINSNVAEMGETTRVLNRIATLVPGDGRKVWMLKEDAERQRQLAFIDERVKEIVKTSEESEHDLMIRRFVELGSREGYDSHIGKTEQKKYTDFKKLSIPMADSSQYGLTKEAFKWVSEIDVLWLKGSQIVKSFEIERSTTIDSGINRFRNLFVTQPNSTIDAYVVIPDKREKEAIEKINSPANRQEGLDKKIKIIKFSELDVKKPVEEIKLNLN